MSKPIRVADCHPDRRNASRGLCRSCAAMRHRRQIVLAGGERYEKLLAAERIPKMRWWKKNVLLVRDRKTASRYGLSVESLKELRSKGCHICGSFKHLHVDHDHLTGKVRGCLCAGCNVFVGHLVKYPEKVELARAYIEKSK